MKKICKVCEKERHMMSWQDTCYSCECDKYLNDVKQNILSDKVSETSCEDNVICPWCGEVQEGDIYNYEYYEEGIHEMQCNDCGRKFILTTNVSYSYDTERLETYE